MKTDEAIKLMTKVKQMANGGETKWKEFQEALNELYLLAKEEGKVEGHDIGFAEGHAQASRSNAGANTSKPSIGSTVKRLLRGG